MRVPLASTTTLVTTSAVVIGLWTLLSRDAADPAAGIPPQARPVDAASVVTLGRVEPAKAGSLQAERIAAEPDEPTAAPSWTPTVTFPDGERVMVKFRGVPSRGAPPSGPATQTQAALRNRAEHGDAAAAFRLSKLLDGCRIRAGRHPDHIHEPVEPCRDVTPDMELETGYWLELSARAGHVPAILDYAPTLGRTDEALHLWESAWAAGSASALAALAGLHAAGGDGMQLSEPDPALAYAYAWLHMKMTEQIWNHPEVRASAMAARQVTVARDRFEAWAAGTDPRDIDAGLAMAKILLKDNPNCCTRH